MSKPWIASMCRSLSLLLAAVLTCACEGPLAIEAGGEPDAVASVERVREHVFFLADDAMRGRASGSPEYERAARYVESRLEDLDLAPLFAESYRQPFFLERQVFGREGSIEWSGPEGPHRFQVLRDVMFMNVGQLPNGTGSFEVVYVGLGIHEPVVGWDDYAGLDLAGKCALMVIDTPADLAADLPAELRQSYADPSQGPRLKAEAAASFGAPCLLGFPSPTAPALYEGVITDPAGLEQVGTVDAGVGQGDALPAAVAISAAVARRLLDGQSSDPFPGGRPMGFDLVGQVRIDMDLEVHDQLATTNLGALLPGTGPQRANEVIVLSAHLDGQGMRGRAVLNSANDNASSVAALLEAARLLAGRPAQRSIAFLFTAAEEDGLLGAKHFLDHPPFEAERVELNVNLEMIGKPARSGWRHRFRVTGRIDRRVDDLAQAVEKRASGVTFDYAFRTDGDGGRHFRNADHVHFFLRGIPTLYFYGGGEAYHQPDDDPERLNYPKVAKMAGVLALLVQESDSWGS